jgi:diaminohydroxyphosphoribosylaminopyrimidine deaminase/5-amino-6-(5-phosphoribosylamino)uracil reductase
VIAFVDPDARVAGRGIARLKAAGVAVETGLCADAARELNAGYLMQRDQGRPLITVKIAGSLDGRIATHSGQSRWISGEAARDLGHKLRAETDAVMIGAGTALSDEPRLTCRLPGLEARSPVRVVVDGRLRLALTSPLVAEARQVPTWIVTLSGVDRLRRAAYANCGVGMIDVAADADGRPSLVEAALALGARGITRLLVEGGGRLIAALLRVRLIDRLIWFRAPMILGGDGIPAAAALGVETLDQAPRFLRLSVRTVGEDVVESYAVLA